MRLREHPNEPIVPEIRPDQEDRMARLRQLERRLTNRQITPMEFIDKNTHSADGVIQQAIDARRRWRNEEADLEETSDDDSDDYIHEDESQDESENEDPNNDGNLVPPNNDNLVSCKSCGQDFVEKYLLVPCGHHPFCNNCQLNEFCTECDANVQIRAKMNWDLKQVSWLLLFFFEQMFLPFFFFLRFPIWNQMEEDMSHFRMLIIHQFYIHINI